MGKVKVLREEIVEHAGGQEIFEVETWGELKLMPRGAQVVLAIFGAFERTDQSTLLYTNTVLRDGRETEQELISAYDSMYMDDLARLQAGEVTVIG